MTTSATQDFLSEIVSGQRIPGSKLAYFETRLSALLHQTLLKIFGRLEREKRFTKRSLAHRIGRKPEQITRWLSYPNNLTLATVSDLFLGSGYELAGVVLADLATGEKIAFPEHPASNHQVSFSALERLEPQRSIVVQPPEEAKPQEKRISANGAASAALLEDMGGKAEAAQLKNSAPRTYGALAEAQR